MNRLSAKGLASIKQAVRFVELADGSAFRVSVDFARLRDLDAEQIAVVHRIKDLHIQSARTVGPEHTAARRARVDVLFAQDHSAAGYAVGTCGKAPQDRRARFSMFEVASTKGADHDAVGLACSLFMSADRLELLKKGCRWTELCARADEQAPQR